MAKKKASAERGVQELESKPARKKGTPKPVGTKTKPKPLSKKQVTKPKPLPKKAKTKSKPLPKKQVTKPKRLSKKERALPVLSGRASALGLSTRFDAGTHGFAFVNSWSFNDLETSKIHEAFTDSVDRVLKVDPIIGPVLNLLGVRGSLVDLVGNAVPQNYGLCGGMAFGALDYYNAGMSIPPGAARPTYGDPSGKRLREYLVRRQVDSLALNLPTILLWIAILHLVPSSPFFKSGAPWLLEQTKEQWKSLQKSLDKQQPVPLALIGNNPDPSKNHQVLAYDYQEFDEGGVPKIRLFVYDMNCPGTGQTIELDFSGQQLTAQESCGSSERGPLKGFICERYTRSRPPAISGFG